MHNIKIITDGPGAFVVLGVDPGKAPAYAGRFVNAEVPEQLVDIVFECVTLGVPLYGFYRNHRAADGEPLWVRLNPQHVLSVSCPPFE